MAELPGEGTYVCTLDAETQKKARKELNEDPKERASKIQAVRDWIKVHPYITARTDDIFILRFLRAAKFSVLDAQKRIEKFCINRTSKIEGAPEWFNPQDVDDPKILEWFDSCLQVVLPKPKGKKNGPTYLLAVNKNMDPKKDIDDMMRAMYMSSDTLTMDENVQIHGIYLIQDMQGMSIDLIKVWTHERIKMSMKVWQDVWPARMKQLNYLHMPAFMNALFEFAKMFMKKKYQDRMKFHTTEKTLLKDIPKECLPNEYGGTAGPLEELHAAWREKVLSNRQEFELLKQCWVDEEKMPREIPEGDSWGMVGSYRKLET